MTYRQLVSRNPAFVVVAALSVFILPVSLAAQESAEKEPRRTRVALGPQFVPSYPGSDKLVLRPLIDVSRTRGDEPFAFEAPDESFGFALLRRNGLSIGPSVGFEGERSADDVGALLPKVGFTLELGGFVQYEASENLRLRGEFRKGLTGHDGIISVLSADFMTRDGDRQLLSFGPRVTITDDTYQNAYFGVRPADAVPGLAAFDAGGGIQSVGAAVGYIRQFTERWGIYSYAKYDRLMGDAGDSPIVRQFGSRDQISGGIALTYTFGRGME